MIESDHTSDTPLRILNYGAGAVGLGLDSFLLAAGQQVDIVTRPNTVAALKAYGLQRRGMFGTVHISAEGVAAYDSLSNLAADRGRRPYDVICVTVKSYDSEHAARDLAGHRQLLGPDTVLVLLQNGWGNADIFRRYFDARQIYNGRVITGYIRNQPHVIKITVHADDIRIGSLFGHPLSSVEPLCRALTAAGMPAAPAADIQQYIWDKMLYNCALNPLGALLNVPYGALAERLSTRELMEDLIREIYTVMDAANLASHCPTAEAYLTKFFDTFVPATAAHRSSMLQDLTAGRQTEIDGLNGAVLQLATEHHLDLPANRTLVRMIRALA